MLFQTLTFLTFFTIVFAIYWMLQRRWQNYFLLIASYVFYGWVEPWWLLLIALTSVVDFTSARFINKRPHQRNRFLLLSLITNISILATYKYFNFFSSSVTSLFNQFGFETDPFLLQVALPVGISFYTFQSASYVIDVYRGKVEARRKLPDYLLFVAFFPQLVAGPILRANDLLVQIEKPRTFDARIARSAVLLILWGLYKKLVIADNVALVANKIFALDTPSFPIVWAGAFAFGVQIYADFSAYTDIARGCSRLLGFELCQNFNHPYLADSPQAFWRRWHISLSTWFRDYVYFPLGGSHGSLLQQCRNLLITFLLSGLWHGAAWNFILWGAWHGALLVLWTLWNRAPASLRPEKIPWLLRVVLTFILIHVGWLMFREQSLSHLWAHLTQNPFTAPEADWRAALRFAFMAAFYALPLYLVHPLIDFWLHRKQADSTSQHYPGWKWTTVITAASALIYWGIIILRSPETADFIYFQF
ncbi:MBOAT family protein [Phragmitibacter flavus]|uniref:MBOAT family protein n=1 Tax=Phragmitibacter flavus TaxID=2576071 RepID=A0A5R8K8E3_9BACT|nr:MBOAT family O-acyltransferase [Phragmitibacter flavus]TLD68607.1 MBOAT family protein [Phragmitibacter flavus]